MKELRVQVERVVRPIKAGVRRKNGMRQELLAHLTAGYQQELERLGNHERALQAALQRFGETAQLTRELQTSIPRWERLFLADYRPRLFQQHHRRLQRRDDETPLEHAHRTGLSLFVVLLLWSIAMVTTVTCYRFLAGTPLGLGRVVRGGIPCFGIYLILLLVYPLLVDGMRKSICQHFTPARSYLRASSYGLLAALVTFGSGTALCYLFNWLVQVNWWEPVQALYGMEIFLPWLAVASAITPLLLVVYTLLSAREIRRFEQDEWRTLEIEE